jgi:hypothetical protein
LVNIFLICPNNSDYKGFWDAWITEAFLNMSLKDSGFNPCPQGIFHRMADDFSMAAFLQKRDLPDCFLPKSSGWTVFRLTMHYSVRTIKIFNLFFVVCGKLK